MTTNPLPVEDARSIPPRGKRAASEPQSWVKNLLIVGVVLYLLLVLFVPTLNVFVQAFSEGIGPFLHTFTEPDFQQAVWLTFIMAATAVPLNTAFGLCAAWAIARKQFPGRTLITSIIDLPFSISPVVAGLMIVLLYGRNGWFGPWLEAHNIDIIFALPGMILASAFVTMPFVAREVIPMLDEVGMDGDEAAKTLGASGWQIFWRVTLPAIRWSLLYGMILTNARAMGEFGAVSVVSGSIAGQTQSLPLFVEEAYKQYNNVGAYTAATVLACLAILTLVLKEIVERQTKIKQAE
jgi:sulfate transport system permease protein